MNKLFSAITVFIAFSAFGQSTSVHQEHQEQFSNASQLDAAFYEAEPNEQLISRPKLNCNLNKVVYGWHPYWIGSAYQNYQWNLLSHLSFFSYEVDPASGNATTTHGWSTSAAVDAALASGNTKVTLCVTLFSSHATFFGSSTAQQTLITNLINLVQTRGAHGVNIDFEGIPASQSVNFCNFMVDLANQMHSAIPGSEVSTVLYAVDWSNVFDFTIMEPAVDQYIIMGYGYYYTGSSTAGPTDPLYQFGSSYNYTLSKTVTNYLDAGCPKDKLVLGLPSYGYEWQTSSGTIGASTISSGSSRTFSAVMNNTSGNYSVANHQWVSDAQSDVFIYNDGSYNQCLISLDSAWRKRLEHVNHTGIAGIGIWALGYDNGYTELWDGINDYLTDCFADPCSGIIHDFGGPDKNYYNNEDYTWTIAPPGATSIDVDFSMFNVETDYDYLYIYDGPDDQSPQISGSPFTGTNSPGQFTTSSGSLTMRFYSDGATVTPGFLASYQCQTQSAPVADFELSDLVICQGDSIQLVNTSLDGDTFLWTTSAGGLSSSTAQSPYLFPASSATYTIDLTVNNTVGTDQLTQQFYVQVDPHPVAIADVSSSLIGIPGGVAGFTNSSLNATDYYWDFGDGANSQETEPWHAYASGGNYTVMLIASNAGCGNDTTYLDLQVSEAGIQVLNDQQLSIYPNPNSGKFVVEGTKSGEEITISDQLGRIIYRQTVEAGKTEINLEHATGIYYLVYGQRCHRIVVN